MSERTIWRRSGEYDKRAKVHPPQTKCRIKRNLDLTKVLGGLNLGALRRVMNAFYWRRTSSAQVGKLEWQRRPAECFFPNPFSSAEKAWIQIQEAIWSKYLLKAQNLIEWHCKYSHQMRRVWQRGIAIYYTNKTCVNVGRQTDFVRSLMWFGCFVDLRGYDAFTLMYIRWQFLNKLSPCLRLVCVVSTVFFCDPQFWGVE